MASQPRELLAGVSKVELVPRPISLVVARIFLVMTIIQKVKIPGRAVVGPVYVRGRRDAGTG